MLLGPKVENWAIPSSTILSLNMYGSAQYKTFFLSAASAVVTENSIVLPPLHCFWVRTTLNSEIKVLDALRSPLLHTIAGSVNQISGDELCHRINDYIDENKISKSIIFLLHLQTHGTFYDGIFFGYRCWRC